MPSPNKLVVDTQTWARGKETAENFGGFIYNERSGKYDIMGILMSNYMGYKRADYGHHRIPSMFINAELGRHTTPAPPLEWMIDPKTRADSADTCALIALNDDITIEDTVRIERIKEILSKHNIKMMTLEEHRAAEPKVEAKPKPKQTSWDNLLYEQRRAFSDEDNY